MAQIGKFMTLDTVAKKLGLSYPQVWRRVHNGGVPTLRVGKSLLVRPEDIKQATNKK